MKRARTSSRRRVDAEALRKVAVAIRKVRPRIPLKSITARASLVEDLGVDSLALAELSIALEDVFGHPVFLGDVLADIEDPSRLTVGQLAEHLHHAD
jgi:acyl carrier protein